MNKSIILKQTLNDGDIIRQELYFHDGYISVHLHILTSNEKLVTNACFHRKFGNKHYISFESLLMRSMLSEIYHSQGAMDIIEDWMKPIKGYTNF